MPVAQVIADFREEVRKTALETKCKLRIFHSLSRTIKNF